MKTILIALAILVLALATLTYTLPIYTLGVLISNIDLIPGLLSSVITISTVCIAVIAIFIWLVTGDLEFTTDIASAKKIANYLIIIAMLAFLIKPFIPKDKETAMILIGAQVLYDSDTARDVATQGADLLKRSVNVFAIKLRDYEKSLESNATKE